MAIQTNSFTRFDAIGVREDLANVIYNISPTETPFINNVGRGKVTNTLFEWQTDALASPSATAQIEGNDWASTNQAQTATVRLGNRTQIQSKVILTTGTLEAVNKAGRADEMAYLMAKGMKELKRDMEYSLLQNQGAVTGSTSAARQTAALLAFLKTNVDKDAGGTNPTYSSGVPGVARTDGTVRTFTETILKSVLQKVWTSGGDPTMVMVGPVNKQRASGFSGVATKYKEVKSGQAAIVGAADVYVGDFGEVSIVPNRFQREQDGFVLQPDMISVDYLRPFEQVELAKTGDAQKRMITVEYGLRVKNEAAQGLAADLITS